MASVIDQAGVKNMRTSFARDMANHQRMRGVEPTITANARLADSTFEKWDRKWTQKAQRDRLAPAQSVLDKWKPGERPSDLTAKKLGADRGINYRIVRDDEITAKSRKIILSAARRQELIWMDARVLLLGTGQHPDGSYTRISIMETGALGQPSWFQRIQACIVTNMSKCQPCVDVGLECRHNKLKACRELLKICEDSIAVFGEWKRDPFTKLSVAVG